MRIGLAAGAGVRAFDMDAAVGLLKRSAELLLKVAFFTGGGAGGRALRERARDAAVGANKPVEGVFGRDTLVARMAGVFGREGVLAGVDLGVDLGADLEGLRIVEALELTDCPVCCGLSG
jgi:hypothetical protein